MDPIRIVEWIGAVCVALIAFGTVVRWFVGVVRNYDSIPKQDEKLQQAQADIAEIAAAVRPTNGDKRTIMQRIEGQDTKLDELAGLLAAHTAQDAENFGEVRDELQRVGLRIDQLERARVTDAAKAAVAEVVEAHDDAR